MIEGLKTDLTEEELNTVIGFVTRFIGSFLTRISIRDVIAYAESNRAIDPRYFLKGIPENIKQKLRNLVADNRELIERELNYDNVIAICGEYNAELARVLSIPKYETWLKKYIYLVKRAVYSI